MTEMRKGKELPANILTKKIILIKRAVDVGSYWVLVLALHATRHTPSTPDRHVQHPTIKQVLY